MTTSKQDYYDLLRISRNASEEEIKKSFRRLALEYHPDRNKRDGAEQRFKEINEAYQVLSDPQKRASYDRFGHAGVSSNAGGFGGSGADPSSDLGDIFGDFFGFGDIFGGSQRGRGGQAPFLAVVVA